MYKLISFYSDPEDSTYYYDHAKTLQDQCKKYGIDSYIQRLEGTGNYFTNCRLKPQFILDCIEKFDIPVLWVDVDSYITGRPVIETKESFLFVEQDDEQYPFHVYCSYFKNDTNSIRLLKEWASRCKKEEKLEVGDHSILTKLIKEWGIQWSKLVAPIRIKITPVNEVQSKRRR